MNWVAEKLAWWPQLSESAKASVYSSMVNKILDKTVGNLVMTFSTPGEGELGHLFSDFINSGAAGG